MKSPQQIIIERARGQLISKTCHPVYLFNSGKRASKYMEFHFAAWLAGNEVDDFMICSDMTKVNGAIYDTSSAQKIVIFGNENDKIAFEEWYGLIEDWYINKPMNEEFIPKIPITGTYTLHFTSFDTRQDDNYPYPNDKVFKAWVWITNNCSKGVWLIEDGWAFACAQEAVKFKLSMEY